MSLRKVLLAGGVVASLLTLVGAAQATTASRLSMNTPVVAAGPTHALFVRPNGEIWSWGSNLWGQLGDQTNNDSRKVVQSVLGDVLKVAAGQDFSLAIDAKGHLWSWGRDDLGQLGNGATSTIKTKYLTPTKIDQTGGWRSVAAGTDHAVAIRQDGTLWGWGANGSGQLCRTSTTSEKTPVPIGTKAYWMAVAAGKGFTVALRADGTMYGCGLNTSGQLNQGTATGKFEALTPMGTARWMAVAAGTGHVLAIRSDGTLWAWGLNDKLQVGAVGNNGATVNSATQISTNSYRSISAGDHHSLGVKLDGTTRGWGSNANKELAQSDDLGPRTPLLIAPSLADGEYVFAGKSYSVVLRASGNLHTFGLGAMCAIGAGAADQSAFTTPLTTTGVQIATFAKPGKLSAGSEFSMAIRSDGTLQAWGLNTSGQLLKGYKDTGPPPPEHFSVANVATPGKVWVDLAAGESHAAGITADGSLWTWGGNSVGQLGLTGRATNYFALAPEQVMPGTRFRRVMTHYAQTFAITGDGQLYACGDNQVGQLGLGHTMGGITTPVLVSSGWAVVAAAAHTTYGIDAQGRLFAWGKSDSGQRGDGTINSVSIPTQVSVFDNTTWVSIAAGGNFAIGLRADGSAWGFGANDANQMGSSGAGHPILTPAPLGGRRYSMLVIASMSVLATSALGEVYCWGANRLGQLGTGDTSDHATPSLSFYFSTSDLSGGGAFYLQNNASGGFRFVTGGNSRGQLGLGWADETTATSNPSDIPGSF